MPFVLPGEVKISPPGRLPHFSGVMMPLVLTHFKARRKIGDEIGSRRGAAGDALGATDAFDQPLAEDVDCHEIGPHAFAHDLAADVDHVAVADAMLVHDGAHLHARAEFAGLRLGAKDRNLRGGEIVENRARHVGERPFRVFLEDEEGEFGTHFLDLLLERGGDVARCFIGDDGDAFVRLEAQAIADGVARAGSQLRINGESGGEETVRHLRSAHHGAKNRSGQSPVRPPPRREHPAVEP